MEMECLLIPSPGLLLEIFVLSPGYDPWPYSLKEAVSSLRKVHLTWMMLYPIILLKQMPEECGKSSKPHLRRKHYARRVYE